MQQLDCESCGTRVLVEKYSESHTSIQWQGEGESRCAEFRSSTERGVPSMFVASCGAMQSSVRRAVRDGRLGESLRTTPIPGRQA